MLEILKNRVRPELKEIVAEASRTLAHLDAARLEELALSCQALNREMTSAGDAAHTALAGEAREAVKEMAVFARVLSATRANADVMNRLRELRAGRLEYAAPLGQQWLPTKGRHGDD